MLSLKLNHGCFFFAFFNKCYRSGEIKLYVKGNQAAVCRAHAALKKRLIKSGLLQSTGEFQSDDAPSTGRFNLEETRQLTVWAT
jgi:hypothetical protein